MTHEPEHGSLKMGIPGISGCIGCDSNGECTAWDDDSSLRGVVVFEVHVVDMLLFSHDTVWGSPFDFAPDPVENEAAFDQALADMMDAQTRDGRYRRVAFTGGPVGFGL